MVRIPWPITSAPGDDPSEGGGRLVNVFAERRGDDQGITWRRAPGVTVFARAPSAATWTGTATFIAIAQVINAAGQWVGAATANITGETAETVNTLAQWRGDASMTAPGQDAFANIVATWQGDADADFRIEEVPSGDMSASWEGTAEAIILGENASP